MVRKGEEAQGHFGRKEGTGQRKRSSRKRTKEQRGLLMDADVEDGHIKVQG
jgi:hypothetical protein